MLMTPMLQEGSDAALRREMEVNVYGMLATTRAFAPILAKNGGGAIVNMLSVVSWFTVPSTPPYCATKHAALVVSDASRIELKRQGTRSSASTPGLSTPTWPPASINPKPRHARWPTAPSRVS